MLSLAYVSIIMLFCMDMAASTSLETDVNINVDIVLRRTLANNVSDQIFPC